MLTDRFFENKIKVALALLLPAFVVYFKSLQFEFTSLDEQWMIVNNKSLTDAGLIIKQAFTKPLLGLYYRPLLLLSFFVDYTVAGLLPAMYHFTNLLLHLACVLLLFRFLRLNHVARQPAFFYSLIFSLHPMMLHAVAWVPGRNDLLLCLFTLASLIYLLKFFSSSGKKPLLLHGLFFIAALLTKETAVMLPLVFMAYYAIHRPLRSKQTFAFASAWILLALGWFLLRSAMVPVAATQGILSFAALKEFVPALLLYTGKAIFPVQQSVMPMLCDAFLLPGMLVLVAMAVLWLRPGLADKQLGAIGLLLFFALLVIPVWYSKAKGGAEHYEHRLYTSIAGLMLFVSQIKFNMASRTFYAVSIIIAGVFAFRSYTRMEVYQNQETFLKAGVKESPGFYLFLFQLGDLFCLKHQYDSALVCYNKAIALRPDIPLLYSNRGSALFALGLFKEAGFNYSKAATMFQGSLFYMNRCVAFTKCNYIELAMADLVILKKCCQSTLQPELEKTIVYKWDLLMKGLSRRIRTKPSSHELLYKRARFHFITGHDQEGLADLRAALALVPGHALYLGLLKQHL
jgi:protein O-mannosyl-transferase